MVSGPELRRRNAAGTRAGADGGAATATAGTAAEGGAVGGPWVPPASPARVLLQTAGIIAAFAGLAALAVHDLPR